METTALSQIVIVGGGQAGGWAAKTLRDSGFEGRIVLLGEEDHPPYERPPLSKNLLTSDDAASTAYLWPKEKFETLDIDFQGRSTVVKLDRSSQRVELSDGRRIPYDRLLLATGSRPRRLTLPGSELAGIYYLRTIDDCFGLRRAFCNASRVVVVGGGWIGLEVAAAAVRMGVPVSIIEAGDQLCGRSLPKASAAYFQALHLSHGVDIRLKAAPVAFVGTDRLERVILADESSLVASAAVIGIGVVPRVELALDSGLLVNNGIVVDQFGRTNDPYIFACGDVTNQPIGADASRLRLETWQNAQNQGIAVAKAMIGLEWGPLDVPWFWSDQYDLNFQMLGMPSADDEVFVKGDPSGGKFIQYFVRDRMLRAAAAFNSPRDLREARKLMAASAPLDTSGLLRVVS